MMPTPLPPTPSADRASDRLRKGRLRPPFFWLSRASLQGASRRRIFSALLTCALLGGAAEVAATTLYKCTGRDGAIAYQDFPCENDSRGETIALPPVPMANESMPALDVVAPTEPDTPVADVTDAPQEPVMPDAWLCVREDGSRYLSDTGIPQRRAVPLAMLGAPQDGLADVYSRGGAGISAPGVRAPVTRRPASGALGAAYVWVEDICQPASRGQLCTYLSTQIEKTESRLRYAFSDTSAQVRQELADLRTRAAVCR